MKWGPVVQITPIKKFNFQCKVWLLDWLFWLKCRPFVFCFVWDLYINLKNEYALLWFLFVLFKSDVYVMYYTVFHCLCIFIWFEVKRKVRSLSREKDLEKGYVFVKRKRLERLRKTDTCSVKLSGIVMVWHCIYRYWHYSGDFLKNWWLLFKTMLWPNFYIKIGHCNIFSDRIVMSYWVQLKYQY